MSELYEKYGNKISILKGAFFKQYVEEVVPLISYINKKKNNLNIEYIKFTIQDKMLKQEESFDGILYDQDYNEIVKVEITCLFEDYQERHIFNLLFEQYGKCSLFHGMKSEHEVKEYIKYNTQAPLIATSYNIAEKEDIMYKKIVKAFDKKNNNHNYDKHNGQIMLIIDYPEKMFLDQQTDQKVYANVKKHIINSNNKFKKGVYLQTPFELVLLS